MGLDCFLANSMDFQAVPRISKTQGQGFWIFPSILRAYSVRISAPISPISPYQPLLALSAAPQFCAVCPCWFVCSSYIPTFGPKNIDMLTQAKLKMKFEIRNLKISDQHCRTKCQLNFCMVSGNAIVNRRKSRKINLCIKIIWQMHWNCGCKKNR